MGTVGLVAAASAGEQPSWIPLVLALLGSSVLGGFVTAVLGNVRASANDRRDWYARASAVLLRRVEFAYRVRRRTSDDQTVLASLSALGSEIQEELALCRAWIASESRAVAEVFDEVCAAIDTEVRPATEEAWRSHPVSAPSEMNLGGWGPRDHHGQIVRLQRAVSWRFGVSRLVPAVVLKRLFDRS